MVTDPAGSAAGYQAVRRTEKIHRPGQPEGVDRATAGHGGKGAGVPKGICGGTAPGGVHID